MRFLPPSVRIHRRVLCAKLARHAAWLRNAAASASGVGNSIRDKPRRAARNHDGPNYWATGTYDPDRYWAAVHEYGHSHMDYIHDAYGDLDTYEANRPG